VKKKRIEQVEQSEEIAVKQDETKSNKRKNQFDRYSFMMASSSFTAHSSKLTLRGIT
jgi:hypothetical protein